MVEFAGGAASHLKKFLHSLLAVYLKKRKEKVKETEMKKKKKKRK